MSMTWMTPFDGRDVGCSHGRVVDLDGAAVDLDVDHLAVDGLGFIDARHVRGHHLSGDDVVGQDLGELVLVLRLEQVLHRAGRQLGEGFVGGGEDRERARALQGVDEAGGFERGGQRLELTRLHRGVDDVLLRGLCADAAGKTDRGCENGCLQVH